MMHGLKSTLRWIIWKIICSVFRLNLAAETGANNEIFNRNFLAVVAKS